MILEKEKFMDRLLIFNYFKRRYSRHLVIQKENLKKFEGLTAKYFSSMRSEEDKLAELLEKVLDEMAKNSKELAFNDLKIVLTYMQSFLDGVYDELDKGFAIGEELNLSTVIPKLQNEIRKKINPPESINQLTFESWFFDQRDIALSLSVLHTITPAITNDKFEYLLSLNDKGSITAWVDILYQRNYVRFPANKLTASLINSKIKNLGKAGISERTLRSPGSKDYKKYLPDLKYLLPKK